MHKSHGKKKSLNLICEQLKVFLRKPVSYEQGSVGVKLADCPREQEGLDWADAS